jgi:predicted metal-dependent enzyme (double-stranded beta helix superfamily)
MKIHELVARCANAAESRDPLTGVRGVLEELKSDLADVERSLAYVSGVGGNARQVFYRSPDLTMLKVCFPAGRRTPPHDHGTWATILLLSGEEKNTLYRRENGMLRRAGQATLTSGSILTMRAETVHVAECISEKPAIGLHVYGGDIFELRRFMFDPDNLEEHPLDWAVYERFAQVASKAERAPLT